MSQVTGAFQDYLWEITQVLSDFDILVACNFVHVSFGATQKLSDAEVSHEDSVSFGLSMQHPGQHDKLQLRVSTGQRPGLAGVSAWLFGPFFRLVRQVSGFVVRTVGAMGLPRT